MQRLVNQCNQFPFQGADDGRRLTERGASAYQVANRETILTWWICLELTEEKEARMYYRVATRVDATPTWQWKSTVLSELSTLFHFLRLFRALPNDQLRVFSSTSREGLAEQLAQENQGLASTLVTAAQFLSERMILPPTVRSTSVCKEGKLPERGAIAVISHQAANERGRGGSALESSGMSALEKRREALESGPGGDHDLPYSLPLSLPHVLAWMTLLVRVQQGELHP